MIESIIEREGCIRESIGKVRKIAMYYRGGEPPSPTPPAKYRASCTPTLRLVIKLWGQLNNHLKTNTMPAPRTGTAQAPAQPVEPQTNNAPSLLTLMQSVASESIDTTIEVTNVDVHTYGRVNAEGVYEQSNTHRMVTFTYDGKTYNKTCFNDHAPLGYISRAKIVISATGDEYVFNLRRVIVDTTLLSKPEVATRCQIVALDW